MLPHAEKPDRLRNNVVAFYDLSRVGGSPHVSEACADTDLKIIFRSSQNHSDDRYHRRDEPYSIAVAPLASHETPAESGNRDGAQCVGPGTSPSRRAILLRR